MSNYKIFKRIEKFCGNILEASIEEILIELRFMALELGDTRLVYGSGIETQLFTEEQKPFLIEVWKSLATWIRTRDHWLKINHKLRRENERLLEIIRGKK